MTRRENSPVVARRGAANWSLEVGGVRAHSSGVFGDSVGAGAIYETARILDSYSEISEALGIGPVRPFDPARRGAADISFVAPHVGAALGGLGPIGGGGHTVEETLEVSSIVPAIQRAALLVYRLTR